MLQVVRLHSVSHQLLALTVLAATCASASAQTEAPLSQHFVPDYLNPDASAFKHNISGSGDKRHFSAYAMSNDDLDRAAANFGDASLNTKQRLLNHQWLYYGHHNIEYQKGSRALRKLVQSGFRAYWDGLRKTKFKDNQVIPDGNGSGQVNELNYEMDVRSDSLELSISYEF